MNHSIGASTEEGVGERGRDRCWLEDEFCPSFESGSEDEESLCTFDGLGFLTILEEVAEDTGLHCLIEGVTVGEEVLEGRGTSLRVGVGIAPEKDASGMEEVAVGSLLASGKEVEEGAGSGEVVAAASGEEDPE